MKNIISTLCFFLLTINLYAQVGQGNNEPVNHKHFTGIPPRSLSNIDFANDINNSVQLTPIFCGLKKKKVNALYSLYFKIDKTGKVVGCKYPPSNIFKGLNNYVKKKFVLYRWEPAYNKPNRDSVVEALCTLYVDFNTDKNNITVSIFLVHDTMKSIYKNQIINLQCE